MGRPAFAAIRGHPAFDLGAVAEPDAAIRETAGPETGAADRKNWGAPGGLSRRHAAPPKAHHGQQAGGAGPSAQTPELDVSTALVGTECQSFLYNNVAQFG